MKWKYKAVMFLTLLIFCVGSVCAAEPDNTTGDGGLNPVNPPINNTTDIVKNTTNIVNVVNMVNSELEKRDIIISNQDLRIKALEDSNKVLNTTVNNQSVIINELVDSNSQLNNTVNNQSVIINSLKADNKVLTDSNKVLTDRVQALEYSKLTQSNRIKSLEIDIKKLDESNKQKDIDIKELNNKLDFQINVNDKLHAEKEKLYSEKCELYEKLLNSTKDTEQLKAQIKDKDQQIKELNNKIQEMNRNIIFLNGSNLDMSFKDGSKYSVKLIDRNGAVVPNAKVIIKVKGVSYDCYTNNDGIASLPINLNPGTYTITATHGKTISNTITIK